MATRQPLTVKGFFVMADGSAKPIENLTKEESLNWARERNARLKRAVIDYYKQHPEELILLEDVAPGNDYEKRA